jgi:hypothetical protein
MLDHVGAQVVAHGLGVPPRRGQEPLDPARVALPELLG